MFVCLSVLATWETGDLSRLCTTSHSMVTLNWISKRKWMDVLNIGFWSGLCLDYRYLTSGFHSLRIQPADYSFSHQASLYPDPLVFTAAVQHVQLYLCTVGLGTAQLLFYCGCRLKSVKQRIDIIINPQFRLHSNTEKIDSCMQGGAEMTTYKFPQFMIPGHKKLTIKL